MGLSAGLVSQDSQRLRIPLRSESTADCPLAVGPSCFRLYNRSSEIDLLCFVPICRDVNHDSVIAAPSVWVFCSRELCRADGQDGSFAAVTVAFISPARTLTAGDVDTLSECEEF